jgi:hypothetical protein
MIQVIERDVPTFRTTHNHFSFLKRDLPFKSHYETTLVFRTFRDAGQGWPSVATAMDGAAATDPFAV